MQNSPTSPTNPYTYLDSGFNRFFDRSIQSNRATGNLTQVSNTAGNRSINFDLYSTSGSLGDKIQVGGVVIDGTNRRIVIKDESGQEVGWIGNISV